MRSQFHHVIDVAPTVLEAAGLPEPDLVHGIAQRPLEGVSMRYCFDDGAAADRRETQYFEMFCNRGIYHKGWMAVTKHNTPWLDDALPAFDDDTWELYDLRTDWTQARDLAAQMPGRLRQLQRQFLIEAASTMCSPSMTGGKNGSTPTWPGGRCWSPATPRPCMRTWPGCRKTPSST